MGMGYLRAKEDTILSKITKIKNKKERERLFVSYCLFYGFFVTSSANTAPTTTMAMITPMIAGMKYKSAADCGAGVGAAVVAAALSTANDVSAIEP
jgi:hypothetical protein